jgi:urocanate hydratase
VVTDVSARLFDVCALRQAWLPRELRKQLKNTPLSVKSMTVQVQTVLVSSGVEVFDYSNNIRQPPLITVGECVHFPGSCRLIRRCSAAGSFAGCSS